MAYDQDWSYLSHLDPTQNPESAFILPSSNNELGHSPISGAVLLPDVLTSRNMADGNVSDFGSWDLLSSASSPPADSPPSHHLEISSQNLSSSAQSSNGNHLRNITTYTPIDFLPTTSPVGQWITEPAQDITLQAFMRIPEEQPRGYGVHLMSYPPTLDLGLDSLQSSLLGTGEDPFPLPSHPEAITNIGAHLYGVLEHHPNYQDVIPTFIPMNSRTFSQDSHTSSLSFIQPDHNSVPSPNWEHIPNSAGLVETTYPATTLSGFEVLNFDDFLSQENVAVKFEEHSNASSPDGIPDIDSNATTSGSSPDIAYAPLPSTKERSSSLAIRTPASRRTGRANTKTTKNHVSPTSQAMQHIFDITGGKDPQTEAKSNAKKAGGRSVGMHLEDSAAARARAMREIGACWNCCLQREKVCHNPHKSSWLTLKVLRLGR
jgi:hypothetical protein